MRNKVTEGARSVLMKCPEMKLRIYYASRTDVYSH